MSEKTELEKMLSGELYRCTDPALVAARQRARLVCREFNSSGDTDLATRAALLKGFFGAVGAGVEIEPPFRCDYGSNIHVGIAFYANFGCVILDCAKVSIGDRVLFGPSVHVYAATHPLDAGMRSSGLESAKSVTIGSRVWVGGGAIICPGVTIGDDTVIGAGSVVTRSIPAGALAVGNPCRVARSLSEMKRE